MNLCNPLGIIWPCCLLCLAVGCGDSKSVRIWGTVTYQGRPIEQGRIIFFPVDDTEGPSTGGDITNGRYDIPARTGPYAGGVYRVEITGTGPERSYLSRFAKSLPIFGVKGVG